jgi:hypothetical protein
VFSRRNQSWFFPPRRGLVVLRGTPAASAFFLGRSMFLGETFATWGLSFRQAIVSRQIPCRLQLLLSGRFRLLGRNFAGTGLCWGTAVLLSGTFAGLRLGRFKFPGERAVMACRACGFSLAAPRTRGL